MCTVTYIPTAGGFHLTSNRDEHISRGQAVTPREYASGKRRLLYPKDPDKNGSWIVAKNNGDVVVLLNGAFVKHVRQINYRKSRGLVLMDIIRAEYPDQFYKVMDLDDIEPFTIVLYTSGRLFECRWDGSDKHITMLDNRKEYIWSSATLYDKMAAAKRRSWFDDWRRSDLSKNTEGIINFHRYGGNGDDKDGLVINRDGKMKTISITSLQVKPSRISMLYHDMRDNRVYQNEIEVEQADITAITPAKTRFFALRKFFIRLFNWEYWPFNIVYAPILPYWFWLSLKARSFFFFNTANPSIENGGFAMESKKLIHKLIPEKYTPKTMAFRPGASLETIRESLRNNLMDFPLIAKPDIGMKGVLVKKVNNEAELSDYLRAIKVDFLLQECIPYKNEVGIFYYRIPGAMKGKISGVVGKHFLTVTGDGRSSIEQLVISEPRYLLQLEVLRQTYGHFLQQVLPVGKTHTLVPYGNHARGAKFIDLSKKVTRQLTETIDEVCHRIPGFYFGRLDVMYNNWEELCEGKNFTIVELNGAGSEPTHIYDPMHSIFFAWREIMRHWKLLNVISRINRNRLEINYLGFKEGVALLRNNSRYIKSIS
ncbi:NRDE family protein [Mucilaginibacter ginsenosidivorans]|uniref:ATP-grasp domain-containing protein n=1 Tax=Mucilaginibacter ginsenosidivorans TaxID=398053 RepID=A0A5B8UXY4_9SPHI|nr:NRDE family protein [Mucilaginibacter ginsenosidivorans]QEC64047.1 hypothetical protein FRZ54_16175 [Mucilaginibacter ginsenosidivorans]